jgi:hypothetical protein
MLLPNLLWAGAHDFISFEFFRAQSVKNVDTPVLLGVVNQLLFVNPATLPLCVLGLWFLLWSPAGAKYRLFGFSYLLVLGCLLALHSSRPDRIAGAYPVLFAAGAVVFEQLTRARARSLRAALALMLLALGAVLMPLALPVLPPRVAARYAQTLGVVPRIEREAADLPEWLAERLGWPELVASIAEVVHGLTPEEQRRAIVLTSGYDVAGAVELFGPAKGLRRVMSPHNSYFLWGGELHPNEPGDVNVAVGFSEAVHRKHFRRVQWAGDQPCDVCLGASHAVSIFVAQDPVPSLADVFVALRTLR